MSIGVRHVHVFVDNTRYAHSHEQPGGPFFDHQHVGDSDAWGMQDHVFLGANDEDPFTVKDSGKRHAFEGGGVRDTEEGKTDYTLVFDGPMFERWAKHLTKGAAKYDARNWMKFKDQEAYDRAKRSALRHFIQWFRGDADEDHAAAVFFNINAAENIKLEVNEARQVVPAPEGQLPLFPDDGTYFRGTSTWRREDQPEGLFVNTETEGLVNE